MDIKPYGGRYPSAGQLLINEGITSPARQSRPDIQWAEGIDITYTFKNLNPAAFTKYADTLLLLAFQEASRYSEYKYKFAKLDVRLGRLKKGRDLPEIQTYQSAMHPDPDTLVYGPGYETPQKYFLYNKIEQIQDIAKRYQSKVSSQRPFRVIRMTICIREPIK